MAVSWQIKLPESHNMKHPSGYCCEDTCNREDAKVAVLPDLVLPQEEGKEHQQASIMHYPPHINVSLHPIFVARIPVNPLWHQYCQLTAGGHTDGLCRKKHPTSVINIWLLTYRGILGSYPGGYTEVYW